MEGEDKHLPGPLENGAGAEPSLWGSPCSLGTTGNWVASSPLWVVIPLPDGRTLHGGLVWSVGGCCARAGVQLLKGEAENLP